MEEPLNWQYGDSEEENEKKAPPPKPILVFADIECALSQDRVFTPNLICWSAEDKEDIHHTDSIPEFLDALEQLTEVEEDDRPRKVITFFYNLCGFHGNFILETLYDQGRTVEKPLTQGTKILDFETGDLVFKDSLDFFAMPLERFPATFHLTELHKGYFPHAWNHEENFAYNGPHPPIDAYDPDSLFLCKQYGSKA